MKRRSTFAFWLLLLYAGLIVLGLYLVDKPWNIMLQVIQQHEESELRIRDWTALLFWAGGLLNLFVVSLFLVTTRWWVGTDDPPPNEPELEKLSPGMKKTLFAAALLSMIVGGLVSGARLDQSLWGDEDFTLRWHLHGFFARNYEVPGFEEDGKIEFLARDWYDAVFGYRTTNNHFLYTILSKATLHSWHAIADREPWEFDETIMRLWPWALGTLAIGAWIWFFARVGLPRVALGLALILPLHPWFSRYLSEARGYSFIFLFLPLLLLALLAAARTGKWRYWIAFGILQVLILYSWPATICQILGLDVVALLIVLLHPNRDRADLKKKWIGNFFRTRPSLLRLGTVCILGGLLTLQMVAPGIPQVQNYLNVTSLDLPVWYPEFPVTDQPWVKDVSSLLSLGMDWSDYYSSPYKNPKYIVVDRLAELGHRPGIHFWMVFFYLFVLVGFVRFARKVRHGLFLVLGFVLPTFCFFYFLGHVRGKYLFHWYFVYLTPIVVGMALLGASWFGATLVSIFRPQDGWNRGSLGGIAVLALTFLWFCWPKLAVMAQHGQDPLKESVKVTRSDYDQRNPDNPENWTALTAHAGMPALCYDPFGYGLDQPYSKDHRTPGLTRLMRMADEAKIPLTVNVGYPENLKHNRPDIYRLLADPELFKEKKILWGQEPQHQRTIYEYRGGFFSALAPRRNKPSPRKPESP